MSEGEWTETSANSLSSAPQKWMSKGGGGGGVVVVILSWKWGGGLEVILHLAQGGGEGGA